MPAQKRRLSDRETLEIDGPAGFRAKLHGTGVALGGLVLILGAVVGYLIYLHDVKSEERMHAVVANQSKLDEHMEEMIYVLSLPDKDRERMHLSMPESLAKKLR